jgi:hypothetical protein
LRYLRERDYHPVRGLIANAMAEVSMAFKYGPPGRIEIVADYDREIFESDEKNNY